MDYIEGQNVRVVEFKPCNAPGLILTDVSTKDFLQSDETSHLRSYFLYHPVSVRLIIQKIPCGKLLETLLLQSQENCTTEEVLQHNAKDLT